MFKPFKPIVATRGATAKTATITVQPSGVAVFNKKARELVTGSYVIPLTDETKPNLVALMFTSDPKDALKVGKGNKGFSGKATLQALGVDMTRQASYELTTFKEGKTEYLVFDKTAGTPVAPRVRKPKT